MINLKLFIWTGFNRDWSDGLAFAIAKNETEAKKLIEKHTRVYDWGDLEIRPLSWRVARCVNGGS